MDTLSCIVLYAYYVTLINRVWLGVCQVVNTHSIFREAVKSGLDSGLDWILDSIILCNWAVQAWCNCMCVSLLVCVCVCVCVCGVCIYGVI